MRIDSNPPVVSTTPERREVKGVSAMHAVKPVAGDAYTVQAVAARKHHESEQGRSGGTEPAGYVEERRKMMRRITKRAVLIELRTGVERRKQLEHIDEQA